MCCSRLISQPLYALGLAHENSAMYAVSFLESPLRAAFTFYIQSWQTPSILLSLSLGLGILISLRQKRLILALGLYVLCERFSSFLDYGVEGVRLMLLFYFLLEHPLLCLLATCSYLIHWAAQGSGYVFFGMNFGMRLRAARRDSGLSANETRFPPAPVVHVRLLSGPSGAARRAFPTLTACFFRRLF